MSIIDKASNDLKEISHGVTSGTKSLVEFLRITGNVTSLLDMVRDELGAKLLNVNRQLLKDTDSINKLTERKAYYK